MFINKKNLFMNFVALVASLGGFQFGYEVGILESIKNFTAFKMDFTSLYDKEFVHDDLQSDMLKFVYKEKVDIKNTWFSIGCVVGTLIVPNICDFFGRKRSILFGAAIFGFGSLFAGVTESLFLFYISRGIMGIGIGILSTICPMYIAETAPAERRGSLITLYQLMITIGIFSAYIVRMIMEYFLQNDRNVQWRVILGIQVVPGFLLLIMMFFLPYSPRYYIWQERDDEALRIVSKLRGMSSTRDPEIQSEFQNMKRSLEVERHDHSTSWAELFKKSMFKRLILVMGLQSLQQLTGINVILSSYSDSYKNDKSISLPLEIISYVNIVVNVIGTFPAFGMIDKYGRKTVLMIGSIGMAISLALSSVASYFKPYSNIFSLVCIFLFVFSFAASWGPAVWVYQSEAFPMRIRSKATSLCSLSNWVFFALIDFFHPRVKNLNFIKSSKNVDYINVIFAVCCFISFFYALFFVRETKGIPLEEIDTAFDPNKEKAKEK